MAEEVGVTACPQSSVQMKVKEGGVEIGGVKEERAKVVACKMSWQEH